MYIKDFLEMRYPINISTHLYMRYKIKSLTKEQKNKIRKGVNINV